MFKKIVEFVENRFRTIIVTLGIVAITAPALIWLFYTVIPGGIPTDISADGILSYIGNVFSGAVTLFVACIAIYQSQEIANMEDNKKRERIRPIIEISLQEMAGSGSFFMTLRNSGVGSAHDIQINGSKVEGILNPDGKSFFTVADGKFSRCEDLSGDCSSSDSACCKSDGIQALPSGLLVSFSALQGSVNTASIAQEDILAVTDRPEDDREVSPQKSAHKQTFNVTHIKLSYADKEGYRYTSDFHRQQDGSYKEKQPTEKDLAYSSRSK